MYETAIALGAIGKRAKRFLSDRKLSTFYQRIVLKDFLSIFFVYPLKTALITSGLILLRCWTNAEAVGISGEDLYKLINPFVRLPLPIPIIPIITFLWIFFGS